MEIQQDTVTFTTVYNDLKDALTAAGEALKTGAEHVYEILVRQQVINSITYLIILAVLFTVGGIGLKYGLKDLHEKNRYGDKTIKESKVILLIIAGIILVIGVIVTCLSMPRIVTGFFNPEYGAIQEVRKFIK
jgi:hypothetical protein